MLFKQLKEQMLLPDSEFIINKSVKVRDKECIVIGMTSQNEENKLWIILREENSCKRDNYIEDEFFDYDELGYKRKTLTNREQKQEEIKNTVSHLNIKSIEIQGKKVIFTSSSGTSMRDNSYDLCMILQHFVENGLTVDLFDEYNTSDLMLYNYQQQEKDEFPKINLSKPMDIKMQVAEDFRQVLVGKPMTVSFGDSINEKHSFYDEESHRNYTFYVNKLVKYDIWEDAYKHFDSEKMKKAIKEANISDEQLQEMKRSYYDIIEQTCPKGMYLLLIEYETEDDIQLNFFTNEFLDARVEQKQGACGILFFTPDNKTGPHGLKNRNCMIKPVEKDFKGTIDIELFSWYKRTPEEETLILQ